MQFYALNSSPNTIRVIKSERLRWVEQVARMGKSRGASKVLVEKRERRRPLGNPWHRWEDNIKTYLRKVGWSAWTGPILLRTGGGLL
jgi:hypothetical protein